MPCVRCASRLPSWRRRCGGWMGTEVCGVCSRQVPLLMMLSKRLEQTCGQCWRCNPSTQPKGWTKTPTGALAVTGAGWHCRPRTGWIAAVVGLARWLHSTAHRRLTGNAIKAYPAPRPWTRRQEDEGRRRSGDDARGNTGGAQRPLPGPYPGAR